MQIWPGINVVLNQNIKFPLLHCYIDTLIQYPCFANVRFLKSGFEINVKTRIITMH